MPHSKDQEQFNGYSHIYFFLGTVAEVIKMYPVMINLKAKGVGYTLIASGQNSVYDNELLKVNQLGNPDITLSTGPRKQTFLSLFFWFLATLIKGAVRFNKEFTNYSGEEKRHTVVCVHGDTLSTLMGTLIAKFTGLKVAHIEAGLRSFNLFNPFPEEITRIIVSQFADISFCPNAWAASNLKHAGGVKIDTLNNTSLESLNFALSQQGKPEVLTQLGTKKFFIFLLHRNEHLVNRKLMEELVAIAKDYSDRMHCLFLLHKPTELVLKKYQLYSGLSSNPNITIVRRMPYVDFIKTLDASEFIITDGGSTQEEAYFLGKPCLVIRKCTERIEGLNQNVLLSKHNLSLVKDFVDNYERYKRPVITGELKPSEIVVKKLTS